MTIRSQWPKLGYGTSPMAWWSAMNFEWASIFSDAKLHKYLAKNTGQCSDRLLRGSILSDYLITILTKNRRFTKEKDWKGEPWNWTLLSLEKHILQWCAQIDQQVIKNWQSKNQQIMNNSSWEIDSLRVAYWLRHLRDKESLSRCGNVFCQGENENFKLSLENRLYASETMIGFCLRLNLLWSVGPANRTIFLLQQYQPVI